MKLSERKKCMYMYDLLTFGINPIQDVTCSYMTLAYIKMAKTQLILHILSSNLLLW